MCVGGSSSVTNSALRFNIVGKCSTSRARAAGELFILLIYKVRDRRILFNIFWMSKAWTLNTNFSHQFFLQQNNPCEFTTQENKFITLLRLNACMFLLHLFISPSKFDQQCSSFSEWWINTFISLLFIHCSFYNYSAFLQISFNVRFTSIHPLFNVPLVTSFQNLFN